MAMVVLFSLASLVLILAPFFMGPGGSLVASTAMNDLDQLKKFKEEILKRYLEEENAFREENISKRVWEKRRSILSNRYLDAARRIDFLTEVSHES